LITHYGGDIANATLTNRKENNKKVRDIRLSAVCLTVGSTAIIFFYRHYAVFTVWLVGGAKLTKEEKGKRSENQRKRKTRWEPSSFGNETCVKRVSSRRERKEIRRDEFRALSACYSQGILLFSRALGIAKPPLFFILTFVWSKTIPQVSHIASC